jgi:hypothetical protein
MADRRTDTDALLARAEHQLHGIIRGYYSSLGERSIAPSLQVETKNYCENLRAILDYLAHEIREKCCSDADPRRRLYFPISANATQFSTERPSRSLDSGLCVWESGRSSRDASPSSQATTG